MSYSVLQRIERFDLTSEKHGITYSISISRPDVCPADAKLPIFLVLDADLFFGTASEMMALACPGRAIVVGIGHGLGLTELMPLRFRDFSTLAGREQDLSTLAGFENDGGPMQDAGADDFLEFITEQVIPSVMARCPQASPEGTIAYGASLAGFFLSYVLLTRPEAFSTYLITSPSLWWNDFELPKRLAATGKPGADVAVPRVFLCVGSREQDQLEAVPEHPIMSGMDLDELNAMARRARMVDAAREFAEALDSYGRAHLVFHLFEDEDHMSVGPAAISRSMRFAFNLP